MSRGGQEETIETRMDPGGIREKPDSTGQARINAIFNIASRKRGIKPDFRKTIGHEFHEPPSRATARQDGHE